MKAKDFTLDIDCPLCEKEVTLNISWSDIDYQPEEKQVINPPDKAHQGCAESAEYTGNGVYYCPECCAEIEVEPSTIEDAYLQIIEDSKHDCRED